MVTKTDTTRLPLHITDRDREVLKVVSDFKILAANQIQTLIPGSEQQILRRLQKLTEHRYLIRHQRTSAHIPYLYQITQRASEELTNTYGIAPERIQKRAKKLSEHDLQHALMVSRLQFAVVRAVAEQPDIELADCILEDELPLHTVIYEEGGRIVKAMFRHDILFLLKYQGRYMTLPAEADRSSERSKVVEAKLKAYFYFWLQEREKAQRGEKSFGAFRVLWTTRSHARMENLRQYSMALNGGKGTALHWFTCESEYAVPTRLFASIWKLGSAGDDTLHHLLESRERERAEK